MLNQFVCLEGVDAVGKTAVGQYIARKLGFAYYKSPGPPFRDIRGAIEDCDPFTRYLFYRAAVQHDSRLVTALRRTRGVVCDRYIYSAMASHMAMDRTLILKPGFSGLVMPDFCFVLTARPIVRRARLAARPTVTALEQNETIQAETDRIFRTFGAEVIDTSDTTVEEVGDFIANRVLGGTSDAA